MDEEVKRQFDAFCASVGMNASVAVNLFAKAVLRERRIPFEISADSFSKEEQVSSLHRGNAKPEEML